MRTRLCDEFGIEYPIFGFTPSPEVAAAITRAGGMGVLGAVRYSDVDELREALEYMQEHCDGKPWGLDTVMPMKYVGNDDMGDLGEMIPPQHKAFIERVLAQYEVPPLPEDAGSAAITGWMHSVARAQLDVAWDYPIALIANALGPPPVDIIAEAHERGIKVAALAGKAKHAKHHVDAGVDIIVAQGHEAGGHCGEVTTMVLVPEVVDRVAPTPVLAAGGIGTGRQAAAALALGAEGVWLGSLWLTSKEFAIEPQTERGMSIVQEKLIAAGSDDTVRSRVISGKPARMLRTEWTEAWEAQESPGTLPMPLQGLLVADAEARIRKHQSRELLGTPVGQIVGQMNAIVPVADQVAALVEEFRIASERLGRIRG